MSKYSEMDLLDRKEFLSLISSIAHKSDNFLLEIETIVEKYKSQTNDKIGTISIYNCITID